MNKLITNIKYEQDFWIKRKDNRVYDAEKLNYGYRIEEKPDLNDIIILEYE